jgi:transcriptional regulator with XRE-family HTH domain
MLRINELRKKKKLSLRKLAELTGIPKTLLNDLENQRRIPKADELKKIADAFQVPEDELWKKGE